MKIIIFGSSGQLGMEVAKAFNAHIGFQVTAIPKSSLDINDFTAVDQAVKASRADWIVNTAAYTSVDGAEAAADEAYRTNADAVANLARSCAETQTRLFHVSTDYVFSGDHWGPYREVDPAGASGVYGRSKLAGENAIREMLDEHIILRTSWVFGVNGTNFVKTMLRLGKENNELGVVADQYGAPTSAQAIAKTIAGIVDHIMSEPESAQIWGTYHYSGFPFVSWAEFAREIFEQAADRELMSVHPTVNNIGTADYPTPAARPANSRLDCSKLKSTFGIEPDDWKTSLGLVLDELKEGM